MRIRPRITAEARARGFTAAELARRLGWYQSNVSAMDAGRRAISLRGLARVSQLLGCSPGELLEVSSEGERTIFTKAVVNRRLRERDEQGGGGSDKSWVHAAQLSWLRHYRARRRIA